jgi:hypothetical protein
MQLKVAFRFGVVVIDARAEALPYAACVVHDIQTAASLHMDG